MNNKTRCFLAFSAGTVVGGLVSWLLLKKKYERFADEQIESVKERFRTDDSYHTGEVDEFMIAPCGTTQYENLASEYTSGSVEIHDEIEIITPEELGEIEEYDTTTLYYYSDGVLVTLTDDIVDNADEIVGSEFPEHFGEYEDDSVCVRNHDLKRDYEILRDSRLYSQVKGAHLSEVEE